MLRLPGKYISAQGSISKSEQVHHLTNTSTCFSGIFTDGEKVTLWYQPDDPSHFITANEWSFNLTFLVLFSIPFFIVLIVFVFFVLRRFGVIRTSQEKTREERTELPLT